VLPARVPVGSEPDCRPTTRRDLAPMQVLPCAQSVAGQGGCQREAVFRSAGLRHGVLLIVPGRRPALPLRAADIDRRSVAVPGHSNGRMAPRFCQTDNGSLCHIAAPGDGRTPDAGGKYRSTRKKCRQNPWFCFRVIRVARGQLIPFRRREIRADSPVFAPSATTRQASATTATLDFGLRALDFTFKP
jgi:hypothetical protein